MELEQIFYPESIIPNLLHQALILQVQLRRLELCE